MPPNIFTAFDAKNDDAKSLVVLSPAASNALPPKSLKPSYIPFAILPLSIADFVALMPAAASPFILSSPQLTAFESCIFSGIGRNIKPNGFSIFSCN